MLVDNTWAVECAFHLVKQSFELVRGICSTVIFGKRRFEKIVNNHVALRDESGSWQTELAAPGISKNT